MLVGYKETVNLASIRIALLCNSVDMTMELMGFDRVVEPSSPRWHRIRQQCSVGVRVW
jgi:hypothetical protein